ncbi:anaphase-promoting complex subunit 7 [Euwallacea similis]|uniref:anaphase-promoting complex subunit 7 n=1 Tax=Euwallacea similis TaxID=1736056 RepID=UPI00344D53F8
MAATSIINQLKLLHDQELYTDIIKVCDLVLTVIDQKSNYLTLVGKFQVTLYYANALYHTHQILQAENLYRQGLHIRKTIINRSKNSNTKLAVEPSNLTSDIEIKYKIYSCCMALKQRKAAGEILQTIPARQRTPKINMALGNIYKSGMERSAITCFKEVLRECPLAIEAMENLLKLGINGIEVNSLAVTVTSEINWLRMWIKAQSYLHTKDYQHALETYRGLDTHGLLKDNTYLAVSMAYCHHYMCEDKKAITQLQRAIRLDPNLTFGRDLLSTLLVHSDNKEYQCDLENLTSKLEPSLWSPEHWVALGNLMLFHKKYDKATYFGQQACVMDSRNVEALFLKANALFQVKKYQEAAVHCTEALRICPFRYDLHKRLVECYLHSNRLREAESVALAACKELNNSPQAYCLHASCLLKDPVASIRNVRRILEKACAQDKNGNTNAVYMLTELLIREQQYEQAVKMLTKVLETQTPTSRLHQLLGECYANLQKDEDAFNHYTVALRLDPQNQRATEGLNNIGTSVSVSKKDVFYSCADESCSSRRTNSDHEADAESDTDLWPGSVDMVNFDT